MKERCRVCNELFEVCLSCDKQSIFFKDKEYQWRKVVCCPQHIHYHIPIIEYTRNEIDKPTAKDRLQEAIDKYGMIDFNDNVKPIVDEIMLEIIEEAPIVAEKPKQRKPRKTK